MTTIHLFDLQAVQRARKWAIFASLILLVALTGLSQSIGGADGSLHESVEALGLGAIVLAIVGRAWCSLYIGGRKKAEVVDRGPYSITRNPLYLFSFLGAFGIGAQSGELTIAALFTLVSLAVFYLTVRREERWLEATFGEAYLSYRERTPRFLPRLSLWQDDGELSIRPAFFLRTLRDGLVFLLAIPVFEAIDMAQSAGWLHILMRLP